MNSKATSQIGTNSCLGNKSCFNAKNGENSHLIVCLFVCFVSFAYLYLMMYPVQIGNGSCTGDSIVGPDGEVGFSCAYLRGECEHSIASS
jgi:hypothetical protein